jgi:hypothetical protein
MKVIDRATVYENMSATRSIQNFGTLLKDKPEKLGQVVSMRPDLNVSVLTESMRNVYKNSKDSKNGFTPINALAIEWEIDVNYIKRVRIVGAPSGAPKLHVPQKVTLAEAYFDRNDTFAAENRQTYFVEKGPNRVGSGKFEYHVTLVGNDPERSGDVSYLASGRTVRFRSNYFPELSERGFTKFFSNTETHRNYISRHRASVDWSADYAIREEVFIQDGKKGSETIYKMNKKEKDCIDTFLLAREQSHLFSETNFDINGKCLKQDEKGRDIPMGSGIIEQIEKVCDKFLFSDLTTDLIEDSMQSLADKCAERTGNHWAYMCNDKFWNKFNKLMATDLRWQKTDGTYLYSKKGGMVKVGATYNSYEFAGNTVTFMINRALTEEYHDRAYAIMLDIGKNPTTGRPNIAMFTLEGSEMISGNINGLGGASGKESGEVSTSMHGSSYHLIGYAGVVVFNPYQSVILEESIAA